MKTKPLQFIHKLVKAGLWLRHFFKDLMMETTKLNTSDLAANVPNELVTLDRWILFRLELNLDTGKYTKVPYQVNRFGASINNPNHWSSFDTCLKVLNQTSKQTKPFDGLGFVFNDDGLVGIDFDKIRNPQNGEIEPVALQIIDSLEGYKEISISGNGVHIITRGKPSWTGRRQINDFGIEVYDRARYFTMSMNVFEGSTAIPSAPIDLSCLDQFNHSGTGPSTSQDPFENYKAPDPNWTVERVKTEILDRLPDYADYDNWLTVIRALHHQFDGDEDGFELCLDYSSRPTSINFCGYSILRAKWDSFNKAKGKNVTTIATLIYMRDRYEEEHGQPKSNSSRPLLSKLKDERKILKKTDWLVDGLIKSESLVMLGGAPSGGKTYVAIELLMCVATGLPVFGRFATKQGDAVYIACEGRDSMMRRTLAWEILKNDGKEVDSVFISDAEIQIATSENAHNSSESLARFMEDSGIRPRLIVIDTMNYSLGTAGENDANQMTDYFSRLSRNLIRRFHATVILVHHTNKDGLDIRGSSTIRGAMDSLYLISQEHGQYKVRNDKQKDRDKLDPIYLEPKEATFTLSDGSVESNIALFWSDLRYSSNGFTTGQQHVLELLEKTVGVMGEMPKSDLIKLTNANKPNFAKNYLNPLSDAGFISYTKTMVKLLKSATEDNDFVV